MPRKRTFDEAELEAVLEPVEQTENVEMRSKLRNMWEFASLMQYIYLFGSVVKIDNDFDIDDLETECLAPQPSQRLAQIGLQLLKFVSSHRGLTPELFDEYTRRQYVAKAPQRNPYGEEEEPAKFDEFDVYTKLRVLHQLSTWTLGNPERVRGMMSQEEDQLGWRIEPIGWDKEDRAYFVLDDDRLYRRTDEPIPPPTPKQKAKPKPKPAKKAKSRGIRTSKRLKVDDDSDDELDATEKQMDVDMDDNSVAANETLVNGSESEEPGYGFTNKTWECIAVTLEDYRDFLASIFRSRDANEKQLRKTIEDDVLPIIEKRADQVRQKQIKKLRELENLQKMATAKRSSRLASKAQKEKAERDEREAEEKKQRELKMAHEEQERQRQIEEGHESRRLTREQRLKDREVKRILHEEELAKLEEAATRAASQGPSSDAGPEGAPRMSERQILSQKERHQKELERMAEDEENWIFDCAICGDHGENFDDGTHSIACERCNVWQHSKCHGFSPKQAEKDGFHFVCGTCKRKEAEAKKPKIPPLKLGRKKSPEVQILRPSPTSAKPAALPDHIARQLDNPQPYVPAAYASSLHGQSLNGPHMLPNGQFHGQHYQQFPPVSNFAPQPRPAAQAWQGSAPPANTRQSPSAYTSSSPPTLMNGYGPPGQHQQQHQHMHQRSLASAGGHRGYQPPYNPQSYSYAQGTPHGTYQGGPSPLQSAQRYAPPSNNSPQSHQQQQQADGTRTHANGVRSPVMPTSKSPVDHGITGQYPPSSLHPGRQPVYDARTVHPQPIPQRPQHAIQPPPSISSPTQSPQKTHPQFPRPSLSPQQSLKTPPTLQKPPLSIAAGPIQTPQAGHPSPAGSNANHIATDGMSGPWPEASKSIPQKQAPSPAIQQVESVVGDKHVLPPVSLAPSPAQQKQFASGPQSVPVKKMLALNEPSSGSVPHMLPVQSRAAVETVSEKEPNERDHRDQATSPAQLPLPSDQPRLPNGQIGANVEWKAAAPTEQGH